jgi:hypothetical protein
MIQRVLVVFALLGLLWLIGAIDLGSLPWHSSDFRISGATVIVYLVWSALESRYRGGISSLPYAVFYSVLLISALDGFLLEITTWQSPVILRWTGLVFFTVGSVLRLGAYREGSTDRLRLGRYFQLAGLPTALGSIAGLAVAVFAGIPGSMHEDMPEEDVEEE